MAASGPKLHNVTKLTLLITWSAAASVQGAFLGYTELFGKYNMAFCKTCISMPTQALSI